MPLKWCPFAVWDSQCSRRSDCGDSANRYEKEKQQWDEVGNESNAPSSLLFHLFLLIFSQFKEDRWQIVVARNI